MKLTLKAWRKAKNKTQEEMAQMLSVTRETYASWENNPEKVRIKAGIQIADFLGVPFDDIIFLP